MLMQTQGNGHTKQIKTNLGNTNHLDNNDFIDAT
jgi:hypothetical protein